MKRILTLVLALVLIFTVFAACNSDPGANDDETGKQTITTDAVTADDPSEKEISVYDYLPDKDYGGYEYRILYPIGIRYFPSQIVAEEVTGAVISDSAYYRNLAIEEAFNVKTVAVGIQGAQSHTSARQFILAGEDAFDVMYDTINGMANLATERLFIDLNTLEYINTEMPWYNRDMNSGLEVAGKQFLVSTDFMCVLMANTYAMFFNRNLAYDEIGLPDLYETVFDGKWTIDLMLEYIKDVGKDLNGDGIMDDNDLFSFSIYGWAQSPIAFQYGMGQFTTEMIDGEPKLILNSPRMSTIVDKLHDLFADFGFYSDMSAYAPLIQFANNKMLFLSCIIMHTDLYFRAMTDDYGVVPHPKYDEQQEKHYTVVNPLCYIYAIPISVSDAERSSVLFEAYSAEGYNYVAPAFYEVSLKDKYSRDNITSQMYDLIMDGRMLDFGFAFDGGVGMFNLICNLTQTGSTDFASKYAERETLAINRYSDVMAALAD